MRRKKTRDDIFKYITVVLVLIFLIAAAFLFLGLWEKRQGQYSGSEKYDGSLFYQGKEYVLKDTVETFLVLGLDKYDGAAVSDSYNNDKQADFLMLFVFDNDAKTCTAVHINRDTMANVRILAIDETKVVDTVTKQIALAHTYGKGREASCRNTKDSVEDLLHGIKVNHYTSFTMDSVPIINDFVGGVEITVMDDFTGIDEKLVKGETVTLMGEEALLYVRARSSLEDSTNLRRMERQRQYINALYQKVVSCMEADESFAVNFIDTIDDYVVYDSSDHKMQKFAEKFDTYQFLGIREIEGETKVGEKFMEFYPDEDSVWSIVLDLFCTPKD